MRNHKHSVLIKLKNIHENLKLAIGNAHCIEKKLDLINEHNLIMDNMIEIMDELEAMEVRVL